MRGGDVGARDGSRERARGGRVGRECVDRLPGSEGEIDRIYVKCVCVE